MEFYAHVDFIVTIPIAEILYSSYSATGLESKMPVFLVFIIQFIQMPVFLVFWFVFCELLAEIS